MHIEGLMEYVEEEYKERLRDLIKLKATVGEKYLHPKDSTLNAWIIDLFEFIEAGKANLVVNKADTGLMNEFFLKMLYAKAND
jgi:hypothetical protein